MYDEPTNTADGPAEEAAEVPGAITASKLLKFIKAGYEAPWVTSLREFYLSARNEIAQPYGVEEARTIHAGDWTSRRPVNHLLEMIRSYMPHVLGESLVPIVEPAGLGDRGSAALVQARVRRWADDAGLAAQDELVVMDAMIGVGVWHVGKCEGVLGLECMNDGTDDPGSPLARRKGFDEIVIDPRCTHWGGAHAVGHRVQVDRAMLLELLPGKEDMIRKLPSVWDQGDSGAPPKGKEEEYLDDRVMLWSVCYRTQGRRMCCVLPPWGGAESFIVEPYEDESTPEGMPYVFVGLDNVPGRPTPISPAMALMDAHLAMTRVASKIVKQIDDLRRKWVADPSVRKMMEELLDTRRDESVVWGDPTKFKEAITGGMVKEAVEGFVFLEALGKNIGPNTDLSGGRDDPSNTATGTSLLAGNATAGLRRWGNRINEGRTRVLRIVTHMLLSEERSMVLPYPMPGMEPLPIAWNPANTMDLSYDQFAYSIRPTSAGATMDNRSKMRSLFEIVSALPGLLQTLVPMGADPAQIVRVVADLSEMGQFDELIPTQQGAMIRQGVAAMLAQQQARALPAGGASGAGGAALTRPGAMQNQNMALRGAG